MIPFWGHERVIDFELNTQDFGYKLDTLAESGAGYKP